MLSFLFFIDNLIAVMLSVIMASVVYAEFFIVILNDVTLSVNMASRLCSVSCFLLLFWMLLCWVLLW